MAATAIITAATAIYGAIQSQDSTRRSSKAADDQKKAAKAREAQLAAEAAATEAAKKKAETTGQRAGFGDPAAPNAFAPTRASFLNKVGGTGFNNVAEDNISKSTLFGN